MRVMKDPTRSRIRDRGSCIFLFDLRIVRYMDGGKRTRSGKGEDGVGWKGRRVIFVVLGIEKELCIAGAMYMQLVTALDWGRMSEVLGLDCSVEDVCIPMTCIANGRGISSKCFFD